MSAGAQPATTREYLRHPVLRESTEREYAGAGDRGHNGTDDDVAVETSIFTRKGV